MRFSVTIPAYKSQFLQEAIESVVSQTYSDWELIIVDDCSPENLHAKVEPFLNDERISYYRNEKNCGAVNVVDNWNICLSHCIGDYVICIGDDDRLLPCCLEDLSKTIKKYPDLNVYHLQTEIIDENGEVTETLEERPEKEDALAMINRKWTGGKQFIGDFCYSRKHLVSMGGYYTLPYAWGSDDITAFRAALPPLGIANTSKVGFQYRENTYSITRAQNEREKGETIFKVRSWYQEALKELQSQKIYSEEAIVKSRNAMNLFIRNLLYCHILNDMRQRGFNGFLFWYKKSFSQEIPRYIIVKLFIKSLLPSWFK
jgi:glycosyltransferase involved in cell wall biosynthesis